MEKMICEKCKVEMVLEIDGSSALYTCPKCGNKIATTCSEGISWDSTEYSIKVNKGNDAKSENLSIISAITGNNYIASKKLLNDGGLLKKGLATEILEIKNKLESNNIKFSITPTFKY